MVVTLPIPPAQLSPNARLHWSKRAGIAKREKQSAFFAAATHRELSPGLKMRAYTLHFFFADRRRRDRDNFAGRCKAALDGIAEYLQQDDSNWAFDGVRFEHDAENPRLEIRFIPGS